MASLTHNQTCRADIVDRGITCPPPRPLYWYRANRGGNTEECESNTSSPSRFDSVFTMAVPIYIAILPLLVVYLYWRALPKPYPAIPHNAASAKRLSGDLPGLLAHYKETKEIATFSFGQCHKLGSPIIQLFLRPFSRPLIFLDDPREIEDILLRRTREFDRAPSTIAMFKPLVPHASMVKMSNNAFKQQRRLWQDVMSPNFLRTVVAPNVHHSALELVEQWRLKSKLASGQCIRSP